MRDRQWVSLRSKKILGSGAVPAPTSGSACTCRLAMEGEALDQAVMMEEWQRVLGHAARTRREYARRGMPPCLEASPLLVEQCGRMCKSSGEFGFVCLLQRAFRGFEYPRRYSRGHRRKRSMARTLLLRCLLAMPEEDALCILESPCRSMKWADNRWAVGKYVTGLHPRQLMSQLERVVRNDDDALGRLFVARKHWLGVDKHRRHRALGALVKTPIGSKCWNLVLEKARKEDVLEMMRRNTVYALVECREAAASSLAEIAEFLGLEERHLTLLHPESGRSLLHKSSSTEDLLFLLDNGLREYLNTPCRSGLTPLDYWLAKEPHALAVAVLLHAGAVPDHKNSSKRVNAVQASKDPLLLELVLERGADLTRKHGDKTCLDPWETFAPELVEKVLAMGFPRAMVTGRLLYEGFLSSPLYSPALERKVDILLDNGADVLHRSVHLLRLAPAELTEKLIRAGIDIDTSPSPLFGLADYPDKWSPLLFSDHACRHPWRDHTCGKTYLYSPLARAAENGNIGLVEALLEYGVDPGKDQGQVSPLLLAVASRRTEVADLLLQHGAPILSLEEARQTLGTTGEKIQRYERFLRELVGRNTKRA